MSADIHHLPPRACLKNDMAIALSVRDMAQALITALDAYRHELSLVQTAGLQSSTIDLINRFLEHIDDLEDWSERLRLTLSLSRYLVDILEKKEKK